MADSNFTPSEPGRTMKAKTFEEEDVVRCYSKRPPYPDALFKRLFAIMKPGGKALDIGCGPGKIAQVLAEHYSQVVAIDPSRAMIEAAKSAYANRYQNIEWIQTPVENFEDEGEFSLITAGSSIHWVNHESVFPKLSNWTENLAIISGDEPVKLPCGSKEWIEFNTRWLKVLNKKDPKRWSEYNPSSFKTEANRHEHWMEVAGREQYFETFFQPVWDFLESQHSRATWSRQAMGERLSRKFDDELLELMQPYQENGVIKMKIVSTLAWGRPMAVKVRT